MRATASGRGVGRDEGEGRVSVVRGMRSGARTCTEGSCVRIRDDIPDANTRFVGGGGIATRRPTRRPRVVPHCLDSSANFECQLGERDSPPEARDASHR